MPVSAIDRMKQHSIEAARLYAWEKQRPAFLAEFLRALGRNSEEAAHENVSSTRHCGATLRASGCSRCVAPFWMPLHPCETGVLGCRVKSRGAGNSVACFRVRRLSKTSITILGDGNSVTFSHEARIESCTIVIRGNGNRVVIGRSLLTGVGVAISGDGNTISVGDACMIMGLSLVCEDDANSIVIAASTQVHGSTELAAIEGTRIRIGESCLFSGGIHFRTGDSHSLTDLEGKRTNPSRDITIGDHVWLGMNVTVLKGVTVPDSSGRRSLLRGVRAVRQAPLRYRGQSRASLAGGNRLAGGSLGRTRGAERGVRSVPAESSPSDDILWT